MNEEFDWQKENLEQVSEVSGECEEITFEEVKVAIKKPIQEKHQDQVALWVKCQKLQVMREYSG